MKDIFGGTEALLKQITDKKKGDRVQLVGFGSFSVSKTATTDGKDTITRKRPGRVKYSNIVLKRISEKLAEKNPELAKKFTEIHTAAHEAAHTVQQRNVINNVTKFKAGSELANNVKRSTTSTNSEELCAEIEIKSTITNDVKDTNTTNETKIYPNIIHAGGSIEIEQDIE